MGRTQVNPADEHRARPAWRGWTSRTKARAARLIFASVPRADVVGAGSPQVRDPGRHDPRRDGQKRP